MSHKQAKGTRKVVRKEWRIIRDRLIEQIKEMPLHKRLELFWRLIDTSPRIGMRLRRPVYAFIEKSGAWGFVARFERSWWIWDGNPMDIQGKGRDGWGLTVCGLRIDWRKDWVVLKPGRRSPKEYGWWLMGGAVVLGLAAGAAWVLL